MEDPKYSQLADSEWNERQTYIRNRWQQLAIATRESRKESAKFVAFVNAGGAVALLAFIGAIAQGNPKAAVLKSEVLQWSLAAFVCGVIVSCLTLVIESIRISGLFAKWRKGVSEFYDDQIGFNTMLQNDLKQASETDIVERFLVGIALFCFLLGAGLGTTLVFGGIG